MFDAAEIARRLSSKPLTVERVLKARRLAQTNRVDWGAVVLKMPVKDLPIVNGEPPVVDPEPVPESSDPA